MVQKYLHTTGILGVDKAKCGDWAKLTDRILQLKKSKMLLSAARLVPAKCGWGGLDILERVSSYWGGDDIFTVFHTFQCWSSLTEGDPSLLFWNGKKTCLALSGGMPATCVWSMQIRLGKRMGKPFFVSPCILCFSSRFRVFQIRCSHPCVAVPSLPSLENKISIKLMVLIGHVHIWLLH